MLKIFLKIKEDQIYEVASAAVSRTPWALGRRWELGHVWTVKFCHVQLGSWLSLNSGSEYTATGFPALKTEKHSAVWQVVEVTEVRTWF